MCLGVPGKVLEVRPQAGSMTMGTVSFGGITKEVCLDWLPEVKPGDYVIVHVGFAISRISEQEAEETFEILRRMGELEALAGETGGEDGTSSGPEDRAERTPPE
ncbi:MAG TPA: HypC/HybG/HupF family hydrogenase formation chaperone [Terriglobales bacterium]|nr:HypC/HybG/HupF family hydrogenase formation chaperone [Terriglobales bacterium]